MKPARNLSSRRRTAHTGHCWRRACSKARGLACSHRPLSERPGRHDSQVGARICNGLGIMRACFETQKLEQLEERVEKIIDHVPYKRIRTEEAEVYVPSGANGHDHAGATRLISADETERHPN